MNEASENSLLSDCSFVILGQGSLPSDVSVSSSRGPQCFAHRNGGDALGNEASDPNSWGSEINPSDIQQKLDLLVRENNVLKETLNQSNLAMKNQFDALVLWQQEVVKAHESHKQKYLETQEHIVKLKTENDSLKKQMQNRERDGDDGSQSKATDFSLINLLEQAIHSPDCVQKDLNQQIEFLTMRNKDLEQELDRMRNEMSKLQEKLRSALDEIGRAKASNSIEETDSKSSSASQQSSMSTVKDANDENKENVEDSFDLVAEIGKEFTSTHSQTSKQDIEVVDIIEDFIEKLRVERANSAKKSDEIEAMRRESDALSARYREMESETERLRREASNAASALAVKEDLLKAKEKDMETMAQMMKKLELKCEEVEILRVQVDVYQTDFNEERRCRVESVEEREALTERVRQLENELKIALEMSSHVHVAL